MMNLETRHSPASLATPSVALKHHTMQFSVLVKRKLQAWLFRANSCHEAFSRTRTRKASCCGFVNN